MAHATDNKELRKVAIAAVVFFAGLIPGIGWLRGHGFHVPPVLMALAGWGAVSIAWPPLIKPLSWFLEKLGWFNTRLLLGIVYYLIFTPVGLFMRLTGKDLLARKVDKSADTYWITKERKEFDPADYDRQF